MKAKIYKVVDCNKMLDTAKISKLEETEVIKILKARKVMRPIVEEYDAFLKDCQEKFKEDGLEEADKVRMEVIKKFDEDNSYRPSQSEIDAINLVNGYFSKVNSAINEEREKEVDLNIETLKEGSDSKLLVANDWTPSDLDKIKIIL